MHHVAQKVLQGAMGLECCKKPLFFLSVRFTNEITRSLFEVHSVYWPLTSCMKLLANVIIKSGVFIFWHMCEFLSFDLGIFVVCCLNPPIIY